MHIAIFADQPTSSLGGAQVSIALQQKWLERAGHRVTVVAPAPAGDGWWPQLRRRVRAGSAQASPQLRRFSAPGIHSAPEPGAGAENSGVMADAVATPSVKTPPFGRTEYALSAPGRRTDAFVDLSFHELPPVDLVHVQGDFWGAFTGYRFAARHGLPVVHTLHNRVETGVNAISAVLARPLMAGLDAWRRWAVPDSEGGALSTSGWRYLRGLVQGASAVTAPSQHFAARLERNGVAPQVHVVPNGIDDDALAAALVSAGRAPKLLKSGELASAGDANRGTFRSSGGGQLVNIRPRFVWSGRMSPEKRFLPFVQAFITSGIDADLDLIGSGGDRAKAEQLVRESGTYGVRFLGRLTYQDTLGEMARADALVQTSVGFETHAMTVFEAAALGTPAVVCDDHVAAELSGGYWLVPRTDPRDLTTLVATLRQAARDIRGGTAPVPDPATADRLAQSVVTGEMLAVYERVLGGSAQVAQSC